jgi:hypothetical protein
MSTFQPCTYTTFVVSPIRAASNPPMVIRCVGYRPRNVAHRSATLVVRSTATWVILSPLYACSR